MNHCLNSNILNAFLIMSMCLVLTSQINAQTSERLHFERYTIEDGLSSDRIQDITQDRSGYMWIATESGLNRYDGYDFFVYSNVPGDSTSISGNFVNAVHADKNGVVWAGTNTGLNRYDQHNDSFVRYFSDPNDPSSLPGDVVYEVFESEQGNIWIGTNGGLAMYNPINESFISEWKLESGRIDFRDLEVLSVSEDKSGTLWIGTSSRGLITYNPEKQEVRYFDKDPIPGISFPTSYIGDVYVDSYGKVWLSFLAVDIRNIFVDSFTNASGLGCLDPEKGKFSFYKHDPETQPEFWDFISDIEESSDSTIWTTSFFNTGLSGLHSFNRTTEKFKTYSFDADDPYSLVWSYATTVFEDRFNNLWVGTSRGLNKADRSKWIMKTYEVRPDVPGLLLNNFYGIEEVGDSILWLGLDGTGFIEWDRNTDKTTHYGPENRYTEGSSSDLSSGNIHIIKKDRDGYVWVGYSGNGVAKVDLSTATFKKYEFNKNDINSLSGNFITGIWVDNSNTVWFSTSNGLSRYNRQSDSFTSWTTAISKLPSNSLSTIFMDKRGNLWLGTKKHNYDLNSSGDYGLIKFDPNNEAVELYQYERDNVNSLSNNAVTSITEGPEGYLWIGTNNGLNRLDTDEKSFRQYHVNDGLPGNVVVGMVFDDYGKLWLSTLKGLSRFDPVSETFRNYDKDDGIQASRYNDYSYFKTSDGELIFGGVSGANYFYPSESFEKPSKPLINLTSILVNNTPYQPSKPLDQKPVIDLDWNENAVGFEFSAINYRSPEQTEYEYKLEGYDEQWISSGTRRFANYTNLDPGSYTFHVKAVNAEGQSSEENASVAISVQPPFWNTWWAYGFYLLLLGMAGFGIDRVQRRRVLLKEKERAREKEFEQAKKIETAYRELEESHKNLKAAQEQLVQQEKLASLGQLTAGIAHEIKNPLNFVNNFSDLSVELIEEAREAVRAYRDTPKQDTNTELVEDLLNDIESNLKTIHKHGTRADSIVKSMLQHSRGGSGSMEPEDMNALIQEYVNLTFHGMRAGKNPINVDIDLQLDDTIGEVPLIAEDFSRVIVNLVNNAFDAMRELVIQNSKLKIENYSPRLTVRTIAENGKVSVEIEDNGPGITEEIKDKILQPFFTTKKGTEGTGLGLSITNDIIKAHGGTISIQSEEGKGTTFTITLNQQVS